MSQIPSNAFAHYEAKYQTGLSDNTPISPLPDQSANGYTLYPSGTTPVIVNNVVNGQPAYYINGGYFQASSVDHPTLNSADAQVTISAVLNSNVVNNSRTWPFGTTQGESTSIFAITDGANSGKFGVFLRGANNSGQQNLNIDDTNWYVITMVYDGSTIKVYVNGTEALSVVGSGSQSMNRIRIGNIVNQNWEGYLAAAYIWKRGLDQTERAELHTYVEDTYGIAVSDYISPGQEITKTQSGLGRISKSATSTKVSTSRISKVFSAANTSSSRLSKQLDISQYGVANISSKTLSTDLIEITFVDGTVYSVTQDSLSRIAKEIPLEQTGIARITRVVSVDQPSTGRIQRILENTIFGLARVIKSLTSTQESLARLVRTLELNQVSQSRVQWIFNLTQDSISRISILGQIPQIARARIVKQLSKTQSGLAAIQWVLLLTQGSTARISKAVSFVNTARAQIAKEFSKTIVGRAWLAFIAEISQPSKASIRLLLEKHQTSQSYIGTAYGNVEIGEDEIYTPSSTVEQDYQSTTIAGDNIYGIAVVEQKQFTETTISSNNIYEVIEHDGI